MPVGARSIESVQGLRQLSYADLLRLYQECARQGGTAAACCPRCGERVPRGDSAQQRAAQQAEVERLRRLPPDELLRLYRAGLGLPGAPNGPTT